MPARILFVIGVSSGLARNDALSNQSRGIVILQRQVRYPWANDIRR